MRASDMSFQERHPIVIPPNAHYTRLLILDAHRQVLHSGVRDTLIQVRERFWIIRARQQVKLVIRRCTICRKHDARHATQVEGQLPADRVTTGHPFQVTGIDFAGPLTLRRSSRRRYYEKAYIIVFTCAVTRAVHLELSEDMTTAKFIQAFRRFIARRGICETVYSDNAPTFKRASKELREVWTAIRDPLTQEYIAGKAIAWKFIAERAPWWGGFYERLIRSVKSTIRKTLSRNIVDFAEMQTLLTEVEAMINSRPLTFVYNEVGEPIPLTPATIICGRRLTAPPASLSAPDLQQTLQDAGRSIKLLKTTWSARQAHLEAAWKRWRKEYLTELRSAYHSKNLRAGDVRVGDVVLIGDDDRSRLQWKMGLVEKVFTGSDGRVRACLLKTAASHRLRRPVQHLYQLESDQRHQADQDSARGPTC